MPVYERNGIPYCVYYDQNGKRVWESFGREEGARESAQARDLEIKHQKLTGKFSEAGAGTHLPYHRLAQLYLDDRANELAANTQDGVSRCLALYALQAIGKKNAAMITLNDWRRIENRMIRKNLKNRTINTYFVYLSTIFDWAVDQGKMNDNPWRKRKRLKDRDKFAIDLFTLAEFKTIRDNAEPHLAWAMEVAFHTGVRPGPVELLRLQWQDVDWKNRRIRIYTTKTESWRWQYLSPKFIAQMKKRQTQDKKDYPACTYIVHYHGQQIKSIKTAWKKAKTKAKITRRIRPYDIRHYYITYALAAGADITELAERVGHKGPRMIVDVYAHLAKDLKRTKAFKLPDIYK